VKTIDLENHFLTPTWQQALGANTGYPRVDPARGLGFSEDAWLPIGATGVDKKLSDMADYRISLMDEAGVDYGVLSLTSPGAEQFPIDVGKKVARDANDFLAAAMKKHPDRFGGFASLAPKDPEWSAAELGIPEVAGMIDGVTPIYAWDPTDRRSWAPSPTRLVSVMRRIVPPSSVSGG
jgi:predicted TIM-barrel fold metal-dependent hydrolase